LNLRGAWHRTRQEWRLSAEALADAVRMAHEIGRADEEAEIGLALAHCKLGRRADAQRTADDLLSRGVEGDLLFAELWLALGDHEKAAQHALAAYTWAWADGEPYVRRSLLNRVKALLETLGVPIPDLPPYDETEAEKFSWEDDVRAVIETLNAEKEAKSRSTTAGDAPPPASPTA